MIYDRTEATLELYSHMREEFKILRSLIDAMSWEAICYRRAKLLRCNLQLLLTIGGLAGAAINSGLVIRRLR